MSKLTFSIRELYSRDPQNGCLGSNGAETFYIAPYQRGFKWQSSENWDGPEQVNTLLRDIYNAWKRNNNSTYYLQFITVKQAQEERRNVLEVIDGQQRLTAISILASVLMHVFDLEDFVGNCIDYYTKRTDIQVSYKVQWLSEIHTSPRGAVVLPEEEDITDQTIWFMMQAFKNLTILVKDRFSNLNKDNLTDFYRYLCHNTIVLVNLVQDNIQSEEVFENLNGRKIPLTDAELIKGLLLCQAARRSTCASYNEILEHRANMGRTWDEMDNWFNRPEVGAFFFEDSHFAVFDFLLMVLMGSIKEELKSDMLQQLYAAHDEILPMKTKRYLLFNHYYECIASPEDAQKIFYDIEDTYWNMRDAFTDIARHNAFGFLLCRSKGIERLQLISKLIGLGNVWQPTTLNMVQEKFRNRHEDMNSREQFLKTYNCNYQEFAENMRTDLMLLNCFVLDNNDVCKANDNLPFPFFSVDSSATKSLEHVQCQNPIGVERQNYDNVIKELKSMSEPREYLLTVREAKRIEHRAETDELRKALKDAEDNGILKLADQFENQGIRTFTEDEWRRLANLYIELMDIHFKQFSLPLAAIRPDVFSGIETECLHSIGNLVLVTTPINTAFGNRMFSTKRRILRDKINAGEKIPPHTFNVFTKIGSDDGCVDAWCVEDVVSNAIDTLDQLYQLRKALMAHHR